MSCLQTDGLTFHRCCRRFRIDLHLLHDGSCFSSEKTTHHYSIFSCTDTNRNIVDEFPHLTTKAKSLKISCSKRHMSRGSTLNSSDLENTPLATDA